MGMTRHITVLLMLICLTVSFQTKADSWFDPSWKEMLDSSDVIALVQYTSEGDFSAKAKILKVYKGTMKRGDEIWVSGFSNRYGPIDKMHIGDNYLVFLNLAEPTEQRMEYWNGELLKKPELKGFVDALKAKSVFYVWSPTSGDLVVKGKKVQYDFIQTTRYQEQRFYSLAGFEYFLEAYYDKDRKRKLCQELLAEIKPGSESDETSQDLMKLYLLEYREYDPVFETYSRIKNPSSKFALALLMGSMENEQSKRILLTLLKDEHSLVQGEAVRQLSKSSSDEVGAVLLAQLKDANPNNSGPNNVMNPVMNSLSGGQTQIILTLGEIGYKPAIPELLCMLDTKDEHEFELIVETLRKLGSRDYAAYINKHLDNLDDRMVFRLCYIIRDDSLTACIPSLMNYIKRHDRTVWPTKQGSIAALEFFKTDTVKQFLAADFIELMKLPNTNEETIDTKKYWVEEYLSCFRELGMDVHKTIVYDYMYDYYGFNSNFRKNPVFFQRKKEIEDSLISVVDQVLKPVEPEVKTTALVFLDKDLKLVNYSVKYQIARPDKSAISGMDALKPLNQLIYSQTKIDKNHLIWSTGNYTGLDGAINFEQSHDFFILDFLNYISTVADKDDVLFIENLEKYNYAKSDYQKEKLEEYLLKAKASIQK